MHHKGYCCGKALLACALLACGGPLNSCSAVQSRDSVQNFLEVAESWNITDGVSNSLAVSRDVHCNSAPFQHSAYDRTVLQQGLLRAVATEAINYILQRKTPVASVVHEQYMPVHEKVAVVGELRSVARGPNLRPFSSSNVSARPHAATLRVAGSKPAAASWPAVYCARVLQGHCRAGTQGTGCWEWETRAACWR